MDKGQNADANCPQTIRLRICEDHNNNGLHFAVAGISIHIIPGDLTNSNVTVCVPGYQLNISMEESKTGAHQIAKEAVLPDELEQSVYQYYTTTPAGSKTPPTQELIETLINRHPEYPVDQITTQNIVERQAKPTTCDQTLGLDGYSNLVSCGLENCGIGPERDVFTDWESLTPPPVLSRDESTLPSCELSDYEFGVSREHGITPTT